MHDQNGLPILQIPPDGTHQRGEKRFPLGEYAPTVVAPATKVKDMVDLATPIADANGCLPFLRFAILLVLLYIVPSESSVIQQRELQIHP